jgi:hypothetical protein
MDSKNKNNCKEIYTYTDKNTSLHIFNIIKSEKEKYFLYIQKIADDHIEFKVFLNNNIVNKNFYSVSKEENELVKCYYKKISLIGLVKTECFTFIKEKEKIFNLF